MRPRLSDRTGTVAVLFLAGQAGARGSHSRLCALQDWRRSDAEDGSYPELSACLADYRFDLLPTHGVGYCLGDQPQLPAGTVLAAEEQAGFPRLVADAIADETQVARWKRSWAPTTTGI
jgi:hypothetical protein